MKTSLEPTTTELECSSEEFYYTTSSAADEEMEKYRKNEMLKISLGALICVVSSIVLAELYFKKRKLRQKLDSCNDEASD